MLSRITHRSGAAATTLFRTTGAKKAAAAATGRRGLVAAPKPKDGPLMERRADRELPSFESTQFRWSRTMPVFLAVVAVASISIFNYQKLSSPVVSSTLYALRTSPKARAYLGDEIYFRQQIPWISGEMNQLHGRIDINFAVKGTRANGIMRFHSVRHTPKGVFETLEWSLETADGRRIDLLEESDPFGGVRLPEVGKQADVVVEDEVSLTRGFRK